MFNSTLLCLHCRHQHLNVAADVIFYRNEEKDKFNEDESAEDEETPEVVGSGTNTENAHNEEDLPLDTPVLTMRLNNLELQLTKVKEKNGPQSQSSQEREGEICME